MKISVARATIIAAIIGALMGGLINVTMVGRWTGIVDQHLIDIDKRLDRLDSQKIAKE